MYWYLCRHCEYMIKTAHKYDELLKTALHQHTQSDHYPDLDYADFRVEDHYIQWELLDESL